MISKIINFTGMLGLSLVVIVAISFWIKDDDPANEDQIATVDNLTPINEEVFSASSENLKTKKLSISFGGVSLVTDVADTPELRQLGLSGKKSLEKDSGMLFVFDTTGIYGFWMKEMAFPIDVIWIDEKK